MEISWSFQENRVTDEDVTHQIIIRWLKWRSAIEVLCDRSTPTQMNGKLYRTVMRPEIPHGSEDWVVKVLNIPRMSFIEMRIYNHTRLDKIKVDHIHQKVQVADIENKIREYRLRWFQSCPAWHPDAPVSICETMMSGGVKSGWYRQKINGRKLSQKT